MVSTGQPQRLLAQNPGIARRAVHELCSGIREPPATRYIPSTVCTDTLSRHQVYTFYIQTHIPLHQDLLYMCSIYIYPGTHVLAPVPKGNHLQTHYVQFSSVQLSSHPLAQRQPSLGPLCSVQLSSRSLAQRQPSLGPLCSVQFSSAFMPSIIIFKVQFSHH